ncbi:MAG: hypothetical protein JSS79_19770 [Bacteroidetes bacterium]|nr:hypothetical protein [Bacteroidota bacterium]
MKQEVAEAFIELTAKHAGDGEKIAVIQRIKTKTGVYIDDISDWGQNLDKLRHADADISIQVQSEVLMNPGVFIQIDEPSI